MFLGVEPEVWLQLWDGVIGSFLAAIIGGLVALGVVRLTTKHQARLASEARERSAIADFAATADELLTRYPEGEPGVEPLLHLLGSSSFRWRMETTHNGMKEEIGEWPRHLASLAMKAHIAGTPAEGRSKENSQLRRSVALVRLLALEWPTSNSKVRDQWAQRLEATRLDRTGLAGAWIM